MSRCSNSSQPLKSQNNNRKCLVEKNIKRSFDGLFRFYSQKAAEWFLKRLSKEAVGWLWKGWVGLQHYSGLFMPLFINSKEGRNIEMRRKKSDWWPLYTLIHLKVCCRCKSFPSRKYSSQGFIAHWEHMKMLQAVACANQFKFCTYFLSSPSKLHL